MMKRIVSIKLLYLYLSFSLALVSPFFAFAVSQPELVATDTINVTKPEEAHAYYGTLQGEPHRYILTASEAFPLRIKVIMADVPESKKDISVAVLDSSAIDDPIVILDGLSHDWETRTDTNGETYLEGPVWDETLEAGNYELRVWSGSNDSSYGLILGEKEGGLPIVCIFISLLLLAAVIWGVYALFQRRQYSDMADVSVSERPLFGTGFLEKRKETEEKPKEEEKKVEKTKVEEKTKENTGL